MKWSGPFFFGIATKFDEVDALTMHDKPTVRIIRMLFRFRRFIDFPPLSTILGFSSSSQKGGDRDSAVRSERGVRKSLHQAS